MRNLSRRLHKLEKTLTDPVGLMPHSHKWMAYWDRPYALYLTGQDLNAIWLSSIDGYRAVMKHAAENPASLTRRAMTQNLAEELCSHAEGRAL